MKVTMTLEGFEATQRALKAAPEPVTVLGGDAVSASSFSLSRRAQVHAPVRTGRLRNAITASARGLSGRVGLSAISGDNQSPSLYWRFVEFGTVHMSAHPMFRPATDEESSDFIRRFREIGPKLERDLSGGRFL